MRKVTTAPFHRPTPARAISVTRFEQISCSHAHQEYAERRAERHGRRIEQVNTAATMTKVVNRQQRQQERMHEDIDDRCAARRNTTHEYVKEHQVAEREQQRNDARASPWSRWADDGGRHQRAHQRPPSRSDHFLVVRLCHPSVSPPYAPRPFSRRIEASSDLFMIRSHINNLIASVSRRREHQINLFDSDYSQLGMSLAFSRQQPPRADPCSLRQHCIAAGAEHEFIWAARRFFCLRGFLPKPIEPINHQHLLLGGEFVRIERGVIHGFGLERGRRAMFHEVQIDDPAEVLPQPGSHKRQRGGAEGSGLLVNACLRHRYFEKRRRRLDARRRCARPRQP